MSAAKKLDLTAVPNELRASDNWVVWKWVVRDGKRTKPPVDPKTGTPGDATDPGLWMSFEDASRELDHADGIGFAIGESPYTGLDLDNCIKDGEIADWAMAIVNRFQSYTEITPSGNGLRIWVRGKLPSGRRRVGNIEMYDSGRYFTITGSHLGGTPEVIADRSDELAQFHAETFPAKPAQPARTVSIPANLSDNELLQRMFAAKNGHAIEALFRGNATGHTSGSEADQALCNHLSFWTGGDPEAIDRLFRLSALCDEKWTTRPDYRDKTITKALDQSNYYSRDYSQNERPKYTQYTKSDGEPEAETDLGFSVYLGRCFQEMDSEWEAPRFEGRKPVVPFPLEVFPVSLAMLCRSGAKASGCPEDFYGVFALVIAGGANSGAVILKVKAEWYESSCIYGAMVARPGSKKSSPLRTMARPLRRVETRYQAEYEVEKMNWEQMCVDAKASKMPCPPPPTLRQLVLDDVTREAVTQIHHSNKRGVVIVNDELSAWVASLNAYRQGKGSDKQFWMSANSGSPIQTDRKGKANEPLRVPRPFITVVGPITPSSILLMKDGGSDDGWFDRIVFSYPDDVPPTGWNDHEIDEDAYAEWENAIDVLTSREMYQDQDGTKRPFVVTFDPDALATYASWVNAHAAEQCDPEFPSVLRGPWSKIEGFCARFALILSRLHQSYDPYCRSAHPANVDAMAVEGGIKLAEYFKDHYRRVRAELYGRTGMMPDNARLLLRWIDRRIRDGGKDDRGIPIAECFTGRDLSQRFRDWTEAERSEALRWLVKIQVIKEGPQPPQVKAGRPRSPFWMVNPLYGISAPNTHNAPNSTREPGEEG